jgi:hypothetical protein
MSERHPDDTCGICRHWVDDHSGWGVCLAGWFSLTPSLVKQITEAGFDSRSIETGFYLRTGHQDGCNHYAPPPIPDSPPF